MHSTPYFSLVALTLLAASCTFSSNGTRLSQDTSSSSALATSTTTTAATGGSGGGNALTATTSGQGGTELDPVVGDCAVEGSETCDDGNTQAGDGCSDTGRVESGWSCAEACSPCLHVSGFEFGELSLAGTVATGTGGPVFTRICPNGHGLIGVTVRDASACNCSTPPSAIGQLIFRCARYTMDASGRFGWDSTTIKDLVAVGSGEQAAKPLPSLHCAADTFMVGLQGATGSAANELTSLKVYCAGLRFATAPTPDSGAIVADGGSQVGPVGEGTLDTNANCSGGALAGQLDGSADAVIEKLSLSCASVTPTFCGDGVQQPFEACDDGNAKAGDGCNTLCQFE